MNKDLSNEEYPGDQILMKTITYNKPELPGTSQDERQPLDHYQEKDIDYLPRYFHYYLLKFSVNVVDFLGSALIYQGNPPPVGKILKNIPYSDKDTKQVLDVIVPRGEGPFPILISIHGGGWISGDKYHYTRIARQFANAGKLVFNVNYRLAPKFRFPIQFQDIAAAVGWTYRNAHRYGGDVNNIFLSGDSAGAHLASWHAAALNRPELLKYAEISDPIPGENIKGMLLLFGVYDLETATNLGFPGLKTSIEAFIGKNRRSYKKIAHIASPIRHIDRRYPPVFLTAGEKDRLYMQSVDMAKALEEIGVPFRTAFFSRKEHPRAGHAFTYRYYLKCAQAAIRSALDFMDEAM